jgi:hypothetical protein
LFFKTINAASEENGTMNEKTAKRRRQRDTGWEIGDWGFGVRTGLSVLVPICLDESLFLESPGSGT